ncbi:MAG: ACT domain-containing protein [Clostridia bacterium]|nr:ACT domain-containing protein [Clostridia bacterium]
MAGIKQISVFLANRKGRIADVTSLLADNNIDIRALSIADTESYGALRMITDDNEKAVKVLKEANFVTKINTVLAIEIPNEPGALAKVLSAIEDDGISVEYIYAFVGVQGDHARVIIRVNDNSKALETLKRISVTLVTEEDVGIR